MKVHYDATPTMARFMDSDAFVRAVVGPLGSGKSSGCVMEILRRSMEQEPSPDGIRHTRWAVIRNTRPQLDDTTRKTFEQWIPERLGTWHEQEFTFTMKFNDVESEVLFRALDRPQDVKKVLSLELTGAYINEAREIPKEVVDGLQGRVGRYPAKKDGGATWFGIWMDTNPWHTGHWGYELFSISKPEGFDLFEQPSGLGQDAENIENLPEDYYGRLISGKDDSWIDEYLRGKYPNADKGSIYGEWIQKLLDRGGILDFEHPRDGVHAVFDLGVSDATSIWWYRIGQHGVPDIIDWYEATGQGASHYFEVLDGRGYKYSKIWLPHDSKARTFQTGISTWDLFRAKYPGLIDIVPSLSIEDGLGATRWLLEQQIRIHAARCRDGLKRLKGYRFEFDEVRKVYSKRPLHDGNSHTADGFRYLAIPSKHLWMLAQESAPPPPKSKVRIIPNTPTAAELFIVDEGPQRSRI